MKEFGAVPITEEQLKNDPFLRKMCRMPRTWFLLEFTALACLWFNITAEIKGIKYEIRRYDSAHGTPHINILNLKGKTIEVITKVFCPKGVFHFSIGLSALCLNY